MDAYTGNTVRLQPACPLCHGAMETGFLVDRGHANHSYQTEWVPGEPRRHWSGNGVSLKERQPLPVVTRRCVLCGFLASFAVQQSQAE